MKKQTKLLLWVGIIIAFINILWMGYNVYQYQNWENWFINPNAYKIYVDLIFYGFLVSFVSHLIVSLTIINCLKYSPNLQIVGAGLLILGCFSFVSLYGDWACLHDVLNEYPQGHENELNGLWILLRIHFAFYFFSLVYLVVVQAANQVAISRSIRGEKLFILLNSIGVVCGILGLKLVYLFFKLVRRPLYKFEIIPFIIILIPYLLIFIYWIMHSISDKKSGWHDEKQKSDIRKSAIVALLFSITLMILFFITNYGKIHGNASILWLPFYIYVVLIVFSSMALYNYKFN
jgi:hypothetical protein